MLDDGKRKYSKIPAKLFHVMKILQDSVKFCKIMRILQNIFHDFWKITISWRNLARYLFQVEKNYKIH